MPKLWNATIDDHRAAVRDAILDAVARMVAAHGLTGVSMSGVAAAAGIGRATLYKYYPDVEAALAAWHGRQIASHLAHLDAALSGAASPLQALRAVLVHLTQTQHGHGGSEIAQHLHRQGHVQVAHGHLRDRITALLTDAGRAGLIRVDLAPDLLADLCLASLAAAEGRGPDEAQAVVDVILAGLQAKSL